jgi:integrase
VATFEERFDREGKKKGWQAKIRRKGFPNQIKTFARHADAVSWAREIETQMDQNAFIDRSRLEVETLGQLIDRHEAWSKEMGRKSMRSITSHASFWRDLFGHRPLVAVTAADIAEIRDRMKAEKFADATIHHKLSALSAVYSKAIDDWKYGGLGLTNVVRAVKWPSLKTAIRKRRVSLSEEDLILQHLEANGPEWLHLAFQLALFTTMRQGEMVHLRWEDVDLTGRTIFLSTDRTKTEESRYVPLSAFAVDILKQLQKLYPPPARPPAGKPDPLDAAHAEAIARFEVELAAWQERLKAAWERQLSLAHARGRPAPKDISKHARQKLVGLKPVRPLHPRLIFQDLVDGAGTLRWWWKQTCKAVGVADLRWHDLRREGISSSGQGGLSLAEQKALSGHSALAALDHYDHPHPEDVSDKLTVIQSDRRTKREALRTDAKAPTPGVDIEVLRAGLLALGRTDAEIDAILRPA